MEDESLELLERLIAEGRNLNVGGECHYSDALDWLSRVHRALTPYQGAQDRFHSLCVDSFLVVPDKVFWALKILEDVEVFYRRREKGSGVRRSGSPRGQAV